jgi:hypothetical protein
MAWFTGVWGIVFLSERHTCVLQTILFKSNFTKHLAIGGIGNNKEMQKTLYLTVNIPSFVRLTAERCILHLASCILNATRGENLYMILRVSGIPDGAF